MQAWLRYLATRPRLVSLGPLCQVASPMAPPPAPPSPPHRCGLWAQVASPTPCLRHPLKSPAKRPQVAEQAINSSAMEGADACRSNGASPEARDARSPPGPNGSLENGAKADTKDTKTTNGHSGEVTEGKTLGSALKSGEGKSALFSSNEWRRPIIQFVESVDDKGSNYFSMDSAEGRRSPYAGLQLGASKKPPVTFAEKGELRKSIFSEPRKPTVTIVEPGEARRNSYPRADLLLRAKSGSEEVLCDSCIGNKQKAVKSCLVCQASFCELHLKPHLEGAAFRDHQLLEPIRDFEARKCPLHGKTMELFCQTDQTCICYLCMFQEHKNHSTVTVEEAKAEKEVSY